MSSNLESRQSKYIFLFLPFFFLFLLSWWWLRERRKSVRTDPIEDLVQRVSWSFFPFPFLRTNARRLLWISPSGRCSQHDSRNLQSLSMRTQAAHRQGFCQRVYNDYSPDNQEGLSAWHSWSPLVWKKYRPYQVRCCREYEYTPAQPPLCWALLLKLRIFEFSRPRVLRSNERDPVCILRMFTLQILCLGSDEYYNSKTLFTFYLN